MFRISVTSQNYTAWTCKKKKGNQKNNWNKERPGFIHRKGKQFTKKKSLVNVTFKNNYNNKKRLRSNSICCTIGIRWVCFVHWGVLGSPFPPTPGSCPVQHTRYSQLPILRFYGGTHTFPFSPSSVFPKARATRALLAQSIQGQQGGDLRVQRFTLEGIFAFGQLWNQIWVLWKEKILPLASEEQCCYSFLSQAAFRNSTEQMQNSTSTGQRAMPAEFCLAHVWFGSPLTMTHRWKQNGRSGSQTGRLHKDQYLGAAWRIWTPELGTCSYTNPHYSCFESTELYFK